MTDFAELKRRRNEMWGLGEAPDWKAFSDEVLVALRESEAECFKLAAGACIVDGGLVGDDGGTPYCTLQAKLKQTRE